LAPSICRRPAGAEPFILDDLSVSRRRAEPPAARTLAQGTAELRPDPDRPRAWTLLVDGTPQSHVDLDDPTYLEFEYIRWLALVADLVSPEKGPLNVLHLGGGAWTLARHLAATRPGSRQRVIEIDGELVEFVRSELPSADRAGIRVRIGDAREVLRTLAPASVDLVVVDVFAGARIPAHLTSIEFVRLCARVLRPDGVCATNLADGAPLTFARGQAATLAAAFRIAALIAPPRVLRGRGFGNLVLVGRHPLAPPTGDGEPLAPSSLRSPASSSSVSSSPSPSPSPSPSASQSPSVSASRSSSSSASASASQSSSPSPSLAPFPASPASPASGEVPTAVPSSISMDRAEAADWLTLGRRLAGDPFPARLVIGADLTRFVAGASIVTDADAVPSPSPVRNLFDRR
jgi:SAM-dependent methyltransferase